MSLGHHSYHGTSAINILTSFGKGLYFVLHDLITELHRIYSSKYMYVF